MMLNSVLIRTLLIHNKRPTELLQKCVKITLSFWDDDDNYDTLKA